MVTSYYVTLRLVCSEPTNNIPPRLSGRKIDGSLVLDVARKGTAVVLCEVPGFPVPRYRSVPAAILDYAQMFQIESRV